MKLRDELNRTKESLVIEQVKTETLMLVITKVCNV